MMQISLVILGCREDEHRRCPNGLVSCSGRGVQSFSRAERCVPLWTRQRRRRCGDLRGWGRRSEMAARMEAADAVRTAGGDGGRRSGLVGDTPRAHRRRPWALPAVPLYHREGVLMGERVQISGAPRKVPW